jgi:hypothetical protein
LQTREQNASGGLTVSLSTEDRLADVELSASNMYAWDSGAPDESVAWLATFARDGVFEIQNHPAMGDVSFGGGKELEAVYESTRGDSDSGFFYRHWQGNHVVEGDGNAALHTCYHLGVRIQEGVPAMWAVGVWRSRLTKSDDGWKFTRRKLELEAHL